MTDQFEPLINQVSLLGYKPCIATLASYELLYIGNAQSP